MLRDLDLQPFYRSDRHLLLRDFYEPCLGTAWRYDRAVGYFTSHVLAAAARGLRPFVAREGRMRLVASPHLTTDDVAAISSGYEQRAEVVERALLRELTSADVPDPVRQRLAFLAWLVAEERLDIKVALVEPGDQGVGIYHEKVGIFRDERDDVVVFTGSANESVGGLVSNFEALEVFRSWLPEDQHRVDRWVGDFDALWKNETPGLAVHSFPEAVRDALLRAYKPSMRPRVDPEAEDDHDPDIAASPRAPFGLPVMPAHVNLRPYQEQALRAWFAANGRGVWEMATGAGKTYTALAAMTHTYRRLAEHDRALGVVVLCPFRHLVDQWAENAGSFGVRAVRCSDSRSGWMPTLGAAFAAASANELPFVLAVTTNQTFAGEAFQSMLHSFGGDLLIIGDEVHNLGAPTLSRGLPPHAAYRLGLSATPERHFDPLGTSAIFDYFGESVFEFTLADAVAAGALVPYRYYPILVSLTDDEEQTYLDLSERIARLAGSQGDLVPELVHGPLEMALFERARLIGQAERKLIALRDAIGPAATTSHNLVYCAEGDMQNGQSQVDAVVRLLGRDLGMRVNTYTHETSPRDREDRRRRFTDGELQALVAIRCLDEGVDIPEARRGFVLASTTNPRQFVQRRGRLLRPAPGKRRAELYDFVVVPPEVPRDRKLFSLERRLVGRELARVVELAETAENGPDALHRLLDLRRRYDLLGLSASGS